MHRAIVRALDVELTRLLGEIQLEASVRGADRRLPGISLLRLEDHADSGHGQPRRIAAAAVGAGQLDASAAQAIAALRDASGGTAEAYAELVGGLGVVVGSARARASAQENVLQRIDESRLSARAVNLDEEMIDMVSAQRGYQASARVITAVDELLDALVNRLGLVDR